MQGRRAGVVSRVMADAIDLAIVLATLVGVYVAVAATRFLLHPRQFTWPEPSSLNLITLGWLLLVAYLAIGWANTGRTFGKTVLGLRVVGRDGGYTKQVGDCVVVVPTVESSRVTPHTEAFQAVVWHCLVSHPDLQRFPTKW